jgi:hypothetical protein
MPKGVGMVIDWDRATVEMPPPKTVLDMRSTGMRSTIPALGKGFSDGHRRRSAVLRQAHASQLIST